MASKYAPEPAQPCMVRRAGPPSPWVWYASSPRSVLLIVGMPVSLQVRKARSCHGFASAALAGAEARRDASRLALRCSGIPVAPWLSDRLPVEARYSRGRALPRRAVRASVQRGALMEFRILGPFEVVEEGAFVVVSAAKQRALLAALLLR